MVKKITAQCGRLTAFDNSVMERHTIYGGGSPFPEICPERVSKISCTLKIPTERGCRTMIDLITLAAICTCISLVVSLVSLTVQCVALYIQIKKKK